MKIVMMLVTLVGILAACGPAGAGEPGTPASSKPAATRTSAPPDEQATGVESALIRQLAGNLGMQRQQVSVVSNERTEFKDACLGVDMAERQCAQVVTPGRIIVLEAEGISYEYHTSVDGTRVQPALPVLTWQREGGIAGFCDRLVVFRSGEVYGNQCGAEGQMGTIATLLGPQERDDLSRWIRQFGHVQFDASDPKGVADRMVVRLSFEGVGDGRTVSPVEEDEFLQFAGSLYGKLFNQAMPQ